MTRDDDPALFHEPTVQSPIRPTPTPLLYELPELFSAIDQAATCYQQDTILFLVFTE